MSDGDGLCSICGGHGAVIQGERVNQYGRTVPNFAPCSYCDQRDRVTPTMEARAVWAASQEMGAAGRTRR